MKKIYYFAFLLIFLVGCQDQVINIDTPYSPKVVPNFNITNSLDVLGVAKFYGSIYYMNMTDLVTNRETINSTTINASEVFTDKLYVNTIKTRYLNASERLTIAYNFGIYSNYSTGATAQFAYVGTGTFGATSGTANTNIFGSSLNGVQLGTSSAGISMSGVSPNTNVTMFTTGGFETARITATRRIGVNIVNPSTMLDINYTPDISSSTTGLTIRTPANYYNGITLRNDNLSQSSAPSLSWFSGGTTLTIRKDQNLSTLHILNSSGFYSSAIGTSGANSYFGLDGGNVGINTQSPNNKLQVKSGANNTNFVYFQPFSASGRIEFFEDAQGDIWQRMYDATGTEKNRIRPDGDSFFLNNLGIGNTTPQQKLTVAGNISVKDTANRQWNCGVTTTGVWSCS